MILRAILVSALVFFLTYTSESQSFEVQEVKFVEHSDIEEYFKQNFEEDIAMSPFMQQGMRGEVKGMRFEINKDKDQLELTYHQGNRSGTKTLKRVGETLYRFVSGKRFQEVSYEEEVPVIRRGSFKALNPDNKEMAGYDKLHKKYGDKLPVNIMELQLKKGGGDGLKVKKTLQVTSVELKRNKDVIAFVEDNLKEDCPFYQQISEKQLQNTYLGVKYDIEINGKRAHLKSYKDENSMMSFSGVMEELPEDNFRVTEPMLKVTYVFFLEGDSKKFNVEQVEYGEIVKIPESVKDSEAYQSLIKKYDQNLSCSKVVMETKVFAD